MALVANQSMRLYQGRVVSSDMSGRMGGSDEAVRGGMSTRGNRLEPSPLGMALGLTGGLFVGLHALQGAVLLA